MGAPGRNSPCPCGSGKRYKDCHGALSDAGQSLALAVDRDEPPALREARIWLNAGDIAGAEASAGAVLRTQPNQPDALRILAACHYERGSPDRALEILLRAARALPSFALTSPQQLAVWSDLDFMFTQSLAGLDRVLAARRHDEYRAWLTSLRSASTHAEPRVTVVVVVPGPAEPAYAALASVFRQTYRNLDVIVIHSQPKAREAINRALEPCPFPCEMLTVAEWSLPALVNIGVRAAAGSFVNVLRAEHRFADSRIATLVSEVADRGLAWGFSGVEFVDGDDRPVLKGTNARVDNARNQLDSIPESDTVGYALIHQEFVAVTESNLFVSRSLFDGLGGFREMTPTFAWDFALRALWSSEPAYVPTPELRYPGAGEDIATIGNPDREAAEIAMFTEYYAAASGDGPAPPNRFAPSMQHWGMHFLKAPFHVGHVLAFSLDRLDRLGASIAERAMSQRARSLTSGVNLVGFPYGEFGLGESLRAIAKACSAGNIPFVVRDVDLRIRARQADRMLAAHVVDDLRHRCSLFCMNPDMLKPVRNLLATSASAGGYNIGYWYWELEHLPREWDDAIGRVDEIWVATDFVADAVRRSTSKPVHKIPPPIDVTLSRPYQRSEFGLPADVYMFLFSFDFNSFAKRKNPEGAIAAFRRAFGLERRDVALVVKTINGTNRPEKLSEMHDLVGGDARIILVDEFFSREQVFGLQSVVDAFVSLHRSEGFGLGLAESMYLGKPVIATAYSGNLEFMDRDNSCLVDYELVPVRKGEYLFDDDRFRWADPDIDQAAHWMRRLVDDVAFRTRIAERGQRDIRGRFTRETTAALIRERLRELDLL
jgi:glycosyltransferase involved in cell wall biosynthesis